jgi:hypothetical protein
MFHGELQWLTFRINHLAAKKFRCMAAIRVETLLAAVEAWKLQPPRANSEVHSSETFKLYAA